MEYRDRPLLKDYMKCKCNLEEEERDIYSLGRIYREPVGAKWVGWLLFVVNLAAVRFYTTMYGFYGNSIIDFYISIAINFAVIPASLIMHWRLGKFEIIENTAEPQE